jgi:protoporphyrinogen oxidase
MTIHRTEGRPRVLILGGGPAGLGAAHWLARRGFAPTVVEAQDRVGGNAGSFELGGLRVDYGSHRLHPATDPEILDELRGLLGGALLERPRHGRILLGGRLIHFPLRPLDLALHAPPSFVAGVAWDAVRKLLPGRAAGPTASEGGETFASVLLRGLGPTVCRQFYFPYARKIWGLDPEEISPAQARRRVSAGSLGQLVRRLVPGARGGSGRTPRGTFFYPRDGYGQISEALAESAGANGGRILLGSRVRRVATGTATFAVEVDGPEGARTLEAEHVWSTIPVGLLARMLDPEPPPEVLHAAEALEQRAMLLVYLVLEQDRYTEYDAHYFPSLDVPMTRLSEPKNYSGRRDPRGRTVLCAEIPCAKEDPAWSADARTLGRLVEEGLARAGLPAPGGVLDVAVRRLPSAYPLYRIGWERRFETLDGWLSAVPGLLTFGRQGLYAHDNTHHALFMARAAVRCLDDDGRLDARRWAAYREVFAGHVVED